jgi:hypothetical protein
VHFPISYDGRERKIAYVEFTDEDAMSAGLEKRAEVLLFFFSPLSPTAILSPCISLRNLMMVYLKSYELLSANHATMVVTVEAEGGDIAGGSPIAACNLPG